jgi:hypothetical protein
MEWVPEDVAPKNSRRGMDHEGTYAIDKQARRVYISPLKKQVLQLQPLAALENVFPTALK